MLRWTEKPGVEVACRWLLGCVFVVASLDKILHPVEFARVVQNYQILPLSLSNLLAMSLPWMELLAGLALVVGVLRAESALVLSGLLIVFIAALSINLVRGVDTDCGCLTLAAEGRRIGLATVLEDLALLGAALVVLRRAMRQQRGAAEEA